MYIHAGVLVTPTKNMVAYFFLLILLWELCQSPYINAASGINRLHNLITRPRSTSLPSFLEPSSNSLPESQPCELFRYFALLLKHHEKLIELYYRR